MASDQRMFGIKKWKAHIIWFTWYHNFTEFHLIFDSISSPNVHMKHLLDTLDHNNHSTLPDGTILPWKTPSPWPRGPLHPRTWPDRWLGRWNARPSLPGRSWEDVLEIAWKWWFHVISQHVPNIFPFFPTLFVPNIFQGWYIWGGTWALEAMPRLRGVESLFQQL